MYFLHFPLFLYFYCVFNSLCIVVINDDGDELMIIGAESDCWTNILANCEN